MVGGAVAASGGIVGQPGGRGTTDCSAGGRLLGRPHLLH